VRELRKPADEAWIDEQALRPLGYFDPGPVVTDKEIEAFQEAQERRVQAWKDLDEATAEALRLSAKH
jgi:hypothetical protein